MGICGAFRSKQATTFIPGTLNGFGLNGVNKNNAVKLEAYPLTDDEFEEKQRLDSALVIFEKIANSADSNSILVQRDDESKLFAYLEFKCLVGIPCKGVVNKPSNRSVIYLKKRIAQILENEDKKFAEKAVIGQEWCVDKIGKTEQYMEFYRIRIRSDLKKEAV